MSDEIGYADPAEHGWVPEERELSWGHPTTLAVASFALSVLIVMGASVFRGLAYTSAFAGSGDFESQSDPTSVLVIGAFLSAAFALLPLLLAVRGLRMLVPDDPAWTGPLLRAAVVLSLVALILRLLLAVLALTVDEGAGNVFGYFSSV